MIRVLPSLSGCTVVAHIVSRLLMPFTVRLYADVHRCGDVRVAQNLLNNLVTNSWSAQSPCDHQVVSAYR